MLIPEYVVTEEDGRLLIARDPYVRRHETRFIGWILILAVPALLGLMWLLSDRPDRDGLAWVAAPFVAVGVGLLIRSRVARFVLDGDSAVVVADPGADVVLLKRSRLCAASEVTAVAMRRSRGRDWANHELLLVTRPALDGKEADSEPVLGGLASHIEEPGRRLADALGVPFERRS